MDKPGLDLFPLGRRIVSRNALAVLGEAGASLIVYSTATPPGIGG